MMTPEFIDQRFYACNAAIKTLIECLVATNTVRPHAVARLLRGQAQKADEDGFDVASALLSELAAFSENPARIAGRRLLNEPPHGNA